MKLAAILLALVLVLAVAPPAAAQRVDVHGWLDAVRQHTPGEWDGSANLVSSLGRADLRELLRDLRSQAAKSPPLAEEMPAILVRAALLHLDVALLGGGRDITMTPEDRMVLQSKDGRGFGNRAAEPGWTFGRELLEGIAVEGEFGEVVRLWYRAASASMANLGQLGELRVHLQDARRRLPDDPMTWFDSGWLFEEFAAPRSQALFDEVAPVPGARMTTRLDLPVIADALKTSEEYYSRALEVSPGFVEARIRRGRVRTLRGKGDDAVADLRTALDTAATDPVLRYFAALLLGGAYESLDRVEPARRAYERAAATYPLAQSPHLAVSRLATRVGDMPRAQREISQLLKLSPTRIDRGDPWWFYPAGRGRYAEAVMRDLLTAARARLGLSWPRA